MATFSYRLLLTLSFIINSIYCNIWDNMFSQMDSPGYIVPNEFNVTFAKNTTPNEALFSISASTELNLIKLSIYEQSPPNITDYLPNNLKFLSEIISTKEDKKDVEEITKKTTRKITKKTAFLDVYLNFTNGTIVIDIPNYNCTFRNVSALKFLTTKFILVSYDILTYYQSKDNFDKFIFTNPVASPANQMSSIFSSPLQWFKDFINDIDLASLVVFKVNPTNSLLEQVDLKFKNYELLDMFAEVHIFDKPDFQDYAFHKNCTEDFSPNVTQTVFDVYKNREKVEQGKGNESVKEKGKNLKGSD